MTVKEAVQVLAILKGAYPNSYKDMTKESAKGTALVWAGQFANVPVDVVLIAINKHIATSPFPPVPCEVRKKIGSLYWEVKEILKVNERLNSLSDEQVNFYKMVLSVAEKQRYHNEEPSIQEMLGDNSRILLLGGGE